MDLETGISLSRRAVLAAAAGGSAALVAKTVLGRSVGLPGPAVMAFNRATIPAGEETVAIAPGIPMNSSTVVICSLMSEPGNRSITYVTLDEPTNSYIVHMNRATRTDLEIGCFAISEGSAISPPVSPPISPPISASVKAPVSGG